MLAYDFEVFKYDWLVVILDLLNKKEHVIVNDTEKLNDFFNQNRNNIWFGFNTRHYDQYIMKGILCGFDPKKINDYIIKENKPGWQFSRLLNKIKFNNYDVMNNLDRGLKVFEGFMGNNIKESSIPFDIDRPLTEDEIAETIKYCRHDVEQTVEVFLKRKTDFDAHLGLVKLASDGAMNLSLLNKTKPQLAAIILDAHKKEHKDEFEIDFPDTLILDKYKSVQNWYADENNHNYSSHVPGRKTMKKTQLETMVAGVPHVFGWGGLHGAIPKYSGEGYYLNMDVASLYPSLMIEYNLHSRNMKDPKKYVDIYHERLRLKAEKNPLQLPLKLVLNSTYGVLKDKNNDLYDPLQSNRVCVYGQLLLLDLIEKLEPYCEIIQSNTDGVLIKLPNGSDEAYYKIDDIAYEWEQRTRLKLEFEEFTKVFQKDVNNYVLVKADGTYKSKGGYVKKLNELDYDLPIVNKALVNYMLNDVLPETTINQCNDLKEFQLVSKISNKYTHILHGDEELNEKCIRIFASNDSEDKGVKKVHVKTKKAAKVPNSPENAFIFNGTINDVKTPAKLDKNWYVKMANKRLRDFGVI